ncbi:hypothetical protein NEOKW01_0976 [Nematocida sp. AWRm80]|nr:hypothetical protein NEOKW01_0976 [Nematocida sp. AWRm80]
MRNSKEIDEYFKIDPVAVEENEERRPSIRRVSFAPETQIVYHTAKEEEESKTESTSMSIESNRTITTEEQVKEKVLEEYAIDENTSLFIEGENEANFIMEDSEDTLDERRMSICHTDHHRTMEHTNTVIQGSVETNIQNTLRIDPVETETPEETEENGSNDSLLVTEMLSEIISTNDNNTLVYDTVNVEEVLSKYELNKQNDIKKIKEILSETGIRFLDNLNLSNRRETLSKVRNKVEGSQVLYYQEYLSKRIEMQNTFSSSLANEIENIRKEIEILERDIDCKGLLEMDRATLTTKLRQLKSEARQEGKMHWHQKRLEAEKAFVEAIKQKQAGLENTHAQLVQETENYKNKLGQMNLSQAQNQEEKLQKELEQIQGIDETQLDKLISELKECETLNTKLTQEQAAKEAEQHKTAEEYKSLVSQLREEQRKLEQAQERLNAAEVQKEDLENIKKTVSRMEIIFGIKILELTHSRIILSLSEIKVTIICDGITIVDIFAEEQTGTTIKSFTAKSIRKIPEVLTNLVEGVPKMLRYILEMASIEKEILLIGVTTAYEYKQTPDALEVFFEIKKGKKNQMGTVTAIIPAGSTIPLITTNIKGLSVSDARYGSITKTITLARSIAKA